MCSSVFLFLVISTYAESCQVVIDFNDVLDRVSNSADNAVDNVNNSVCGHLVAVNNPSAVHGHHLDCAYVVKIVLRLCQKCQNDTD